MSYSMTGFGRSEITKNERQILVEIKTLNGKNLDTTLKIPSALRVHENELRTTINNALLRGTIDCKIEWRQNGQTKLVKINKPLAISLYADAKELCTATGGSEAGIMAAILKMPEVMASEQEDITQEQLDWIKEALHIALTQVQQHRAVEGQACVQDLTLRIQAIQAMQASIAPLEALRIEKIKSRITHSLDENFGLEKIDHNRLEQELIFYVEKIDISEEQIRLTEHCRYFLETITSDEHLKGKKLGFILQEIGREINTLGSKANDAAIQRIVINMKDELEKAKEQVLNLL